MSSYNENLQKTISSTLNSLYADQQKMQSEQRSAQYNLYYAQGAQINTGDSLANTNQQLEDAQNINTQAVLCDNAVINLLATSTTLQANTTTAVSNVAAMAANIKVASNSISKVAANIGSALNIALASSYDTDIYKRTQQANYFISQTANDAEYTSQLAMEASSQCSELMSTDALNSVTASKTQLEALLSVTNADVSTLSEQSVVDQQALNNDKKAERKAEGVLQDANCELKGVDESVDNANSQLNLDVTVDLEPSSNTLIVSSQIYDKPFQDNTQLNITVPSASATPPEQYVFIAKASNQSSVTLEQVETLFGEYKSNDASINRFYQMTTKSSASQLEASLLYGGAEAVLDIDGDKIVAGGEYVAFVYVELSLDYQRYIGVYDNMVSSASASFTPVYLMPAIKDISVSGETITIDAGVDGQSELRAEFRVMLLPKNKPSESGLMTSPEFGKIPFYFNVPISQQVSSANYISHKVQYKGATEQQFTIDIGSIADVTDNFGSPLVMNDEYVVAVLSLPESAADLPKYLPELSLSENSFTYINPIKPVSLGPICSSVPAQRAVKENSASTAVPDKKAKAKEADATSEPEEKKATNKKAADKDKE
jgi:hypothetical protein